MNISASILIVMLLAAGQGSNVDRVRTYRQAHEHEILREFTDFLAIPNLASDGAGIRKNAAFLVEMMKRRGLAPKLLEASDPSAPPAVYGERLVKGATRTLVFY